MDKASQEIFQKLYDLHDRYDESPEHMICAHAADHIKKLSEELEKLKAAPENNPLTVERFEAVCESVHNGWWEECKRQGRTNHPDMKPYDELPESVKDYDRVTVQRVLDALSIPYSSKPEGSEKA